MGDCLRIDAKTSKIQWNDDIEDMTFMEPTPIEGWWRCSVAKGAEPDKINDAALVTTTVASGMSGAVLEASVIGEAGGGLLTTGTVMAVEPVGLVALEGGYGVVMGPVLYGHPQSQRFYFHKRHS